MIGAELVSGSRAPRWFVVLTLPQKEVTAYVHLRNQAFEAFLPQTLKRVRHARKTFTKLAPIFPRYLFVHLDPAHAQWRRINGTIGVANLVGFGDGPTPVPHGIVEALRSACGSNGAVQFQDMWQPGQAVRLAAGPFAERLGVLHKMDGSEAVRILLEIMGRQVEVRTDLHNVLPAT